MQRIYLDNAATTSLSPEVVESMMPFLTEKFGNPSSIYSYGRECKMAIEKARKSIAQSVGVRPSEIYFTSCGTESTNTAIQRAIQDLGCRRLITSPIEHHATLHTVEYCKEIFNVPVDFVELDEKGHIQLDSLRNLLSQSEEKCLVTLMHANNEIGNISPIEEIGQLCHEFSAIFHCDTVQTIAHYPIDFKKAQIHFASCSAHKFHGPKGIGFLYISSDIQIHPFIHGGSQERNKRAGTENIYGIIGMAKALELAQEHLEAEQNYIQELKFYMTERLKSTFSDIHFNGDCEGKSLYTVLNVGFPKTAQSEMLIIQLDIDGICVSGGSACSSGAQQGSHVIHSIYPNISQTPIRFSFSKYNTKEEIDTTIHKIASLLQPAATQTASS